MHKTKATGTEKRVPQMQSATEALQEAEAREPARHRDDTASPYFTGEPRLRIDRRRFLLGSVAAAGAASALSRSKSLAIAPPTK
jgi:hypothetical protein